MEPNQIQLPSIALRNPPECEPSDRELVELRRLFEPFDNDFWASYLAGAPAALDLPTDRPRPSAPSGATGNVKILLQPELTAELRRLSQRHGTTLGTTLLAGWSALLGRLSGQLDLVIGLRVATPPRDESQPQFVSPSQARPVRIRLEGDPSVAELLARMKADDLWTCGEQSMRSTKRPDAQRGDSRAHHSIFEVMFEFGVRPASQARTPATPPDLCLSLEESEQQITGALAYASDLFDLDRIERLGSHLRMLLQAMVDDDQHRFSKLNILSPPERRQLLNDWSGASADYPIATLTELFAAQTRRSPHATAVIDGTRHLSYFELDQAADSLAAVLQQRGVVTEAVVGVALHRSLETVVAAWAILKAGGVYLPLDPSYPARRLSYMLHDSRATLVITEQGVASLLPDDLPRLYVEERVPKATPSPTNLTPDHLSYIIYTSGSTGEPKGVAISHASAANLSFARGAGHDPIGPGDRVVAASSVGFDVSVGQLLLPLLAGACVVIAPDLRALSAEEFWALLATQRVTHINSVPSFFDSVLDAAAQQDGLCLERVMLGGEALSGALCRRIRATLPRAQLFNIYGPTEACIEATAYRIEDEFDDSLASVPIGRPHANYRAYVLDDYLNPQPVGVPGELYLGGAGLARNYVGQPGLTAERFVADPFGLPGARLYRTGDRALWRPDGTLLFLGRRDEQLKIRGFRIEPGEIEAVLLKHPQIAHAAVIPRTDGQAAPILVAYVVPVGKTPEIAALREFLAQALPAHMIPAAFVGLSALPINANGKLDRKMLPAAGQGTALSQDYEAPQGEEESAIARVWQTLLKVPRVGRHDDFFALGGYSLLVARVVETLKTAFGRPIPMALIYRAPTPAQLAAAIRQIRSADRWKHLVPLNEGGSGSPLFCLNGFDGAVDPYLHIARLLYPSVPVYGLEVESTGDDAELRATLASRMDLYEKEIRIVQPVGPYRLCGYSFGGAEAYDLACRLEAAGEEVTLILLDTYRPSLSLDVLSWVPRYLQRIIETVRSKDLHRAAAQKMQRLFTDKQQRGVTGKDKNLETALARLAARRKYSPFNGRVILFKALRYELWAFQLKLDGYNGWRKYIKGPLDVIQIESTHFDMVRNPAVRSVANHLAQILCN